MDSKPPQYSAVPVAQPAGQPYPYDGKDQYQGQQYPQAYPQAYPAQPYPQQGYPQQGYPQQGYPQPYAQQLPAPGLSAQDQATAQRRMQEQKQIRTCTGLMCGGFLCALCIGTDRAAHMGNRVIDRLLCMDVRCWGF